MSKKYLLRVAWNKELRPGAQGLQISSIIHVFHKVGLTRVLPHGRLTAEHHGIAAVQDGIGHIAAFLRAVHLWRGLKRNIRSNIVRLREGKGGGWYHKQHYCKSLWENYVSNCQAPCILEPHFESMKGDDHLATGLDRHEQTSAPLWMAKY